MCGTQWSGCRPEADAHSTKTLGGSGLVVQADLTRVEEIRRLFAVTLERFGRLDVVVQNAGQALSKAHVSVTEEEFERLFALNARGTFFVLQEAARHIADGGRIVYISSGSTLLNLPGGGAYGGSKIAGERFVKDLAVELGPRGITVNALCTHSHRAHHSYREVARIPDFYTDGDSKVIFAKRLAPEPAG